MLVKQPKNNKFRWMIALIGVEFAALAAAYGVWRYMNHSRDFRLYMHKNYPMVLSGFYSLGEAQNPYYNLAKLDENYWIRNGDMSEEQRKM